MINNVSPQDNFLNPNQAISVWKNLRLCTMRGEDWDIIENAMILTQHDKIVAYGNARDLDVLFSEVLKKQSTSVDFFDLEGALVTPGLIDCHTHLVYAGDRSAEFEQRLLGVSYEEIAKQGGGIRSTVMATRLASFSDLLDLAIERAMLLKKSGVTTLEVKSGYGLTFDDEKKCLGVARELSKFTRQSIHTTYLGAHALPNEYQGNAQSYIEQVIVWMKQLHQEGLIDAVDAFCEHLAFSVHEVTQVFSAARELGLPIKLHAEQLSNQHGAQSAASLGALSCDHLEYLDEEGVKAMSAAGTVAVLLPGAYYFLRETQLPPMHLLRNHKVPIAISTDHNPGTSPCLDLSAMLSMACTLFKLTPYEAFSGVTKHAAKALGLSDRGMIERGKRADFAIWNVAHPRTLCYEIATDRCLGTVIGGVLSNA